MDVDSLRVDLARTQDRIARARENGDTAAVMIAESRLRRVDAELSAALGLRTGATGSTAPITVVR